MKYSRNLRTFSACSKQQTMHRIVDGKLVPEQCSGYPFCDACRPPRLTPISEIIPKVLKDVHPLNDLPEEVPEEEFETVCRWCRSVPCQCDAEYDKKLDRDWFPEDYDD